MHGCGVRCPPCLTWICSDRLLRARLSIHHFTEPRPTGSVCRSVGFSAWKNTGSKTAGATGSLESSNGYGTYSPDLPGCIATGKTLEKTRERMRSAIEMHLKSMRDDGDIIPEPSHVADMLEVA